MLILLAPALAAPPVLATARRAPTPLPALAGASWWPVLHAGDDVAGVDFGAAPEGTPDGADANTLRLVDGHLQLVTHFERGAGAIFVTELIRDPARGFRAVRTSRVEDGVESVYNPCAAGLARTRRFFV